VLTPSNQLEHNQNVVRRENSVIVIISKQRERESERYSSIYLRFYVAG
jgi:hypothetical protein